jgi:hypothetical protein
MVKSAEGMLKHEGSSGQWVVEPLVKRNSRTAHGMTGKDDFKKIWSYQMVDLTIKVSIGCA